MKPRWEGRSGTDGGMRKPGEVGRGFLLPLRKGAGARGCGRRESPDQGWRGSLNPGDTLGGVQAGLAQALGLEAGG